MTIYEVYEENFGQTYSHGFFLNKKIAKELLQSLKEQYPKSPDLFKIFEFEIVDNLLTFKELREANVKMTEECFPVSLDWDEADWMLALIGEVGELANWLKKRKRGETIPDDAIKYEIADIQFYLDKLANYENINMEEALREKYNIVATRFNSNLKL